MLVGQPHGPCMQKSQATNNPRKGIFFLLVGHGHHYKGFILEMPKSPKYSPRMKNKVLGFEILLSMDNRPYIMPQETWHWM